MKKYFVVFILYFISGFLIRTGYTVLAQEVQVDSLKKLLLVNSDGNKKELQLLNNLGQAYLKIKNYDSSLVFFKAALLIDQKMNSPFGLSLDYLGLGKSISNASDKTLLKAGFEPLNRNKLILDFFQKAVDLGVKSKNKKTLSEVYKELSEFYEKQNKPKLSFDYYKKYIAYKDSISNIVNANTVAKLQHQYDTEKKEQVIALLKADKKIAEKEISKKKTERNGFMAGCTLLLLTVGVAFNRYMVKQKANKELSGALSRLKELQQQLVEKEKAASLGQLTAGIAHEIQNPLNFVINFSQLNKRLLQEWDETTDHNLQAEILLDIRDNATKVERHGNRANGIIQSMLMHSRDSHLERELTDFNELCQEALNFSWQAISINNPEFVCNNIVRFQNNLPFVNLVKQDISRVVVNLLNNSFYAVKEKFDSGNAAAINPEITIETFLKEKNIILEISDNGNGIPESLKNKIFQPFFTTKPTNMGTGLGLSISNDIAKAHSGELYLQSSSTEGTKFVLSLPV